MKTDDHVFRAVVELLVLASIGLLLLTNFVVEAYVVPTGSMAPTLVGHHYQFDCPNCGLTTAIGMESSVFGDARAACPHCGHERRVADLPLAPGERILVLKHWHDLRAPKRQEPIVFSRPDDPRMAYVKRVVALPGEKVAIREGNVWINDQLAPKPLTDRLPPLVTVHVDRSVFSTKTPNPGWRPTAADTGWSRGAAGWRLKASAASRPDPLVFVGADGEPTVTDVLGYNLHQHGWERQPTPDFAVAFTLRWHGAEGRLEVRHSGHPLHRFRLRLAPGAVTLLENQKVIRSGPLPAGPCCIRFGVIDRQCWLRVDGKRVLEDVAFLDADLVVDLERAQRWRSNSRRRPAMLELVGDQADAEVDDLRVERDVFYTDRVGARQRRWGVDEPVTLGPREYFMLGDNSAVSEDSRCWEQPAVPDHLLIGRPVLVVWPARHHQVTVFGRTFTFTWPDWRQIRRIR